MERKTKVVTENEEKKEELKKKIEEMKEKLKKKDEELISMGKEIETTKRELQSAKGVIERHKILDSDIDVLRFKAKKAIKEKNIEIEHQEQLIKELQERDVCKVCLDKEVKVVFTTCGHFATCYDCAEFLNRCPICRIIFSKKTVLIVYR